MAAQYTPGPWHVSGDGGGIWSRPNDPSVAVAVSNRPLAERDANARLIAAAPDLLAALDMCRAIIKFHCKPERCCAFSIESEPFSALDAHDAAVAAIARATQTPEAK
jgi:hypothetical protein